MSIACSRDQRLRRALKGCEFQILEVRGADEFERASSAITRADALLVFPSVMLFNERVRISDLAAKHRLPTISAGREFAELGGLISYGVASWRAWNWSALRPSWIKFSKATNRAELPRRTADEVRAGDQYQDRQGARDHDAADVARPRRAR